MGLSSALTQQGSEGSVETVPEGKGLAGVLECETRVGSEDRRDLRFIFLNFKGTGGVYQSAARLETGQGMLDDPALKLLKGRELTGAESPAGIYPTAKDACI